MLGAKSGGPLEDKKKVEPIGTRILWHDLKRLDTAMEMYAVYIQIDRSAPERRRRGKPGIRQSRRSHETVRG
jgi:hypothetical protein